MRVKLFTYGAAKVQHLQFLQKTQGVNNKTPHFGLREDKCRIALKADLR